MTATTITGEEVRTIRTALGLSVADFATVLSVHPSSVHRWEAARQSSAPIEGVARPLLTALGPRVFANEQAKRDAAEAGKQVAAALITAGLLGALIALLVFATSSKSA